MRNLKNFTEMATCSFCKLSGHKKDNCSVLKSWFCNRCKLTGHTRSHCPISVQDLDFPPLSSGKAEKSTHSPKPCVPVKSSVNEPQKMQSYQDLAVENTADRWLKYSKMIFEDIWFRHVSVKTFEDPFLNLVMSRVMATVRKTHDDDEFEQKDRFYANEEIREKREADYYATRDKLRNSMTEEQWDDFLEEERDAYSLDLSEWYEYDTYKSRMDSLEANKLAWEAFLVKEELAQKEYRFRKFENSRNLNPISGRQRPSTTLADFM